MSYVPTLVSVLGKELSRVQFRSLDEQLFRSMAVLFDQQERHGVARLVGMNAPVSIRTPTVSKMPGSPERIGKYLAGHYDKLAFALSGGKARELLAERATTLAKTLVTEFSSEAETAKRKLR
ncbi:MAG TPA: hypothetical protein VHO24_14660 [Opitutaceae bacterium]|nr:hypothetical protein [Opitutaceae bacterium]